MHGYSPEGIASCEMMLTRQSNRYARILANVSSGKEKMLSHAITTHIYNQSLRNIFSFYKNIILRRLSAYSYYEPDNF
jgi:hypothetical protein